MNFTRPEMLFFVWVIPALALVYWYGGRRREKILKAFALRQSLARIIPQGLDRRRRWRAWLVLGACALLATALAGPRYGFRWQEIERKGVDIVIALDCSRSMLASDIQPTRLDRAKREIYDLLTMLQGDRVGLVAFSGTAFLQCPLTIDYTAFYLFLDVLTPDYLPLGGSDLAAAVSVSQQAFDPQSTAERAIILITDGENTGSGDPMEAAEAAQASGIKLFCIGVGSNEGVPIPASDGGFKKDPRGQIVLSRLDEPLLTRMATKTGGAYVRSVAGDMDLEAVYSDQIRAHMDGATVESSRKKVWADRYQWPLTFAIVLLMCSRWVPLLKNSTVALLMASALLWPASPACAGPRQEGYEAYQANKFDDAMEHFTKAQVQKPHDPAVLYNLGNTLYRKQDFAGAAEHYRQAMPHASDGLKARLLYNLGNTAYRQGALQEAIENYEAAVQLAPGDRQSQENLAYVKQQLQQQKQQQQQNDSQPDPKKDRQQESSGSRDQQQQNQSQQSPQGRDQQQGQAPPQPQSEMETKDQPKPEDQQSKAAESQEAQPQDQAPRQGRQPEAQLLNRLKDQPGRAMMPNYRKKEVDKDW
ncbi:MAG: VWA domain-containing protein [Desulfobacteraceae bacterium]|jgi:Ca-activated chloride channel family protein